MALRSRPADASPAKPPWKQRLRREFIRYWINFLYLVVFFGAFAWYRRFILDEYRLNYFNYGTAVIEALVLAKVILIGDALGLDRGPKDLPLIYPTLRNAVLFSCFVGLFVVVEHMLGGILHGIGVAGGLAKLWHEGKYELLARCLVTLFAFIPFFACREIARTMGEGSLWKLFLKKGEPAEFGAPS